ncbi:MAG: hypothetical protein MJZ57_01695 [Bacteroidales bacterium]|nr:hypothetical protein [Bacteroidales bacterium]
MKNKFLLVGVLLSYLLFFPFPALQAQYQKTIKPNINFWGEIVAWEDVPSYMADLYNGSRGTDLAFDSCKIVNQDNGYKIIIAKGMDLDTIVRFACVLEFKDGFQTREGKITTTCECRGTCASGCDPEYLGGSRWICTGCEYDQGQVESTCIKSVTAKAPSDNQ